MSTAVLHKKRWNYRTFIHIFFIIFSLTFIIPLVLVISASLTNEDMLMNGYRLIPRRIDITAYKYAFEDSTQLINSYAVTILEAFLGTLLSTVLMALCAYPLSRSNFRPRKIITYLIFFTMLFGGGLIPTYILNTKYLHLGNTIWIYIVPGLASAWNIIIFRTFFQGLPESLVEAAKIDGASELHIFFRIIIPLSTPVLATLAFFGLLDRWNDWYTALIYIRNAKLYSLQYLLQKLLMDAEFLKSMQQQGISLGEDALKPPTETFKFAMCVLAAGPMMLIFPFFQKYFAKGLLVGSVKG